MLTAHTAIVFFSTVSQSILISLMIDILPGGIYIVILLCPFISLLRLPELGPQIGPHIFPLIRNHNPLRHAQQFPIVQMHTTARANLVEQEHDVLS
jgi:hypothetical protein